MYSIVGKGAVSIMNIPSRMTVDGAHGMLVRMTGMYLLSTLLLNSLLTCMGDHPYLRTSAWGKLEIGPNNVGVMLFSDIHESCHFRNRCVTFLSFSTSFTRCF